ncbi:MAG: hypothetical protein ACRBCI_01870 [Cellvibrionaceae bacterium]
MVRFIHLTCIFLLMILVSACSSFNVKEIGKSDIDLVADTHRQSVDALIYELMGKLYKRNPRELSKQAEPIIGAQVQRLRQMIVKDQPLLVDGDEDIAILRKGFSADFQGDRVFHLMAGLISMTHKSYNYRSDFFLFDKLDQQKLYNSARNIEVFAWLLRTSKDASGQPVLLSTALKGPVINLSFERLIGKMIALQDMMAVISADGDRRTIKSVAQGVIRAIFLPI